MVKVEGRPVTTLEMPPPAAWQMGPLTGPWNERKRDKTNIYNREREREDGFLV
jgi:hypothetical protein